jgi:hypothetical protein
MILKTLAPKQRFHLKADEHTLLEHDLRLRNARILRDMLQPFWILA